MVIVIVLLTGGRELPYVVAYVLDNIIVVRKFKLQSRCYIPFLILSGKGMNPLTP